MARSSAAPLSTYSQDFDAGFLKDGCECCHTVAGQKNLGASLGLAWPSLLVWWMILSVFEA